MSDNTNASAYAEVYNIIQHSSEEVKEKIPRAFVKFLKENMNKEKEIKINYDKPLNNIQEETKILLGIIYRDFLCDTSTKEMLILQEKKDFAVLEIQEKFAEANKNRLGEISIRKESEIPTTYEEAQKNLSLVKYEDSKWYGRVWKKVRSFFKRKGWVLWE